MRALRPQQSPRRRVSRGVKAIAEMVDKSGWGDRWTGATVVCMASGPSLSAEDVEVVRQWRAGGPDRRVIVVNTTCSIALWADATFAMDQKWWRHPDHAEAIAAFAGERVCIHAVSGMPVTKLQRPDFKHFGNSGTGAVSLAALAGAARVVLLGYDCQRTGGKAHWHGDHPKGLGNAASMPQWLKKFENAARALRGVEIINCSRATALTCWPRGELSGALA